MASFAQHVNTAVVISGISIAPLYSSSLIDINQAFALLFFGMIGGILPDIDLENSKPIQITSSILSIFIPLLAILTLLESLSISKMLFIWFLSSMLLHFIIFRILLHLTIHRGVIHSVPMGLLFSQSLNIMFYTIFEFTELFSLLCGVFLFFGFIIHLVLDEIVSLNAFGMNFKKSLGTALKFYDGNNLLGSVFIYTSIIILQIIYPLNLEHLITIFNSFKNVNL
jgi:hypothetical protein